MHFGNFVTVRAAKSIISSKCVFNPSCGLHGVFKIKILDLILDQTEGLEGPKLVKKHYKINDFLLLCVSVVETSRLIIYILSLFFTVHIPND